MRILDIFKKAQQEFKEEIIKNETVAEIAEEMTAVAGLNAEVVFPVYHAKSKAYKELADAYKTIQTQIKKHFEEMVQELGNMADKHELWGGSKNNTADFGNGLKITRTQTLKVKTPKNLDASTLEDEYTIEIVDKKAVENALKEGKLAQKYIAKDMSKEAVATVMLDNQQLGTAAYEYLKEKGIEIEELTKYTIK